VTTYVAFLRAINVGGHAVVKMTALRDAFTAAGCKEVRTLIASGNVLFEAPAGGIAALERRIRAELGKLFDTPPGLFIRTVRDVARLVEANPFRRYAAKPRLALYVAFLSRRPRQVPRLPLRSVPEMLDVISVMDREAFIVSGRKKNGLYGFPNLFIEKQLDVTATCRNWKTVVKIALTLAVLGCASAPPPARAPRPSAPAPAPSTLAPRTSTGLDDLMRRDMVADRAFAWSTRRLTWDDFQGDPPTDGSEGAVTSYTIYSAWKCRGDAFEFRVVAGFRPRQSWVKAIVLRDSVQRRTVLVHEQTHFDLAEVHARLMRRAFRELDRPCRQSDGELSDLAQRLGQAEKAEQRRYDAETKHGLLGDEQTRWSLQTRRRLTASN
jgi:uncharacterized protein (DUF1697 family)